MYLYSAISATTRIRHRHRKQPLWRKKNIEQPINKWSQQTLHTAQHIIMWRQFLISNLIVNWLTVEFRREERRDPNRKNNHEKFNEWIVNATIDVIALLNRNSQMTDIVWPVCYRFLGLRSQKAASKASNWNWTQATYNACDTFSIFIRVLILWGACEIFGECVFICTNGVENLPFAISHATKTFEISTEHKTRWFSLEVRNVHRVQFVYCVTSNRMAPHDRNSAGSGNNNNNNNTNQLIDRLLFDSPFLFAEMHLAEKHLSDAVVDGVKFNSAH